MLHSFSRDNIWAKYEFELQKHWQQTMTTDLKTNYDAETCTSDVERSQESS